MTVLTLRLSDQPVITLPAELARLAGLEEGQVRAVPDEHRVTVMPMLVTADYSARWDSLAAVLREQVVQFAPDLTDRRDASYWELVASLFAESERSIGSA